MVTKAPVKKQSANSLTADLLVEIPKRFPFIVVWRSNRIEAMAVGRGGKKRRVSAGIDGQGDISGIIGGSLSDAGHFHGGGRRLEIEVKTTDRQRLTQIAFESMIKGHGGVYILTRDVETCINALKEELS